MYLISRVAALKQRGGDPGQVSDRVQPLGGGSNPVKVRSQSHVIDARDLGDMVNMIDQRLERWTRELRRPLFLDRRRFLVCHGAAVGMRMSFPVGIKFSIALLRFLGIG